MVEFPVSGVETFWWLPFVVALAVSSVTSLGGLTGAFLLLPFQVSVLGYVGPSVSATNLLFNVVATPSGVITLARERRLVWPVTAALSIGTVPGVLLGAWIRVTLLPDPVVFKGFAALVLAYMIWRLLLSLRGGKQGRPDLRDGTFRISHAGLDAKHARFSFLGADYVLSTPYLVGLSALVGVVSAAYGIGGGAILAPYLVGVFGLPVYAAAGPAMAITMLSSLAGVGAYLLLGALGVGGGVPLSPDWALGLSFGLGGSLGIALGSRLQKHVPAGVIKILLAAAISVVVVKYGVEVVTAIG